MAPAVKSKQVAVLPNTKVTTSKVVATPAPKKVTSKLAGSEAVPLLASNAVASNGGFSSEWMQSHNSYLATQRDPVAVAGVRIPDGQSPRTVTLQYVRRQLLLANDQGVCGFMMGYNGASNNTAAANPGFWVPQGYGAEGASLGWTCGDASTVNQLLGETIATGHNFIDAQDLFDFFDAYASKVRVVSAALNLQPAVGFEDADGTYVCGSLPPNYFNSAALSASNMSFAYLQNRPGSVWAPIYNPKSPGVTTTYAPTDNSCVEFSNVDKTQVNYTDADYNATSPGVMYAFASQKSGDTGANHMLQVCVNYEIELKSGTLAFGAGAGQDDPLAMATTINARRSDPLCFIGSDMFGMSAVSEAHQGSLNSPLSGATYFGAVRIPPCQIRSIRSMSFSRVKGMPACACGKMQGEVQELENDKPLFESLVDTLGSVVKRGLPNLFPVLKKL